MCWQDVIDRCHACAVADPTADIPRLTWEQPALAFAARYLGTLASALRPRRTAASFAYEDVAAAVRFMLLSTLPLAALLGVIPHTRTLRFPGAGVVSLIGDPTPAMIGIDVARAMMVQLLLTGLEVACLLVPYHSLVRSYAPPGRDHAALRVVLYRSWLLPLSGLVYFVGLSLLPIPTEGEALPSGLRVLALAKELIPLFLLLAMVTTARLACGLGPFISMVVVLVPVALYSATTHLINVDLPAWLLPAVPSDP